MRFLQRDFLISCGLAFAAFCNIAQAADCKPLQILNTIKLESADDGDKIIVPVTINGTPEKFVLDTGGYTTQLGHKTASALGLKEEENMDALFDAYGHASRNSVTVDALGLGRMTARKIDVRISPLPNLEDSNVAGLLSTNLFLLYDIDLDFGAGRLNYFSQDHCDGKVAYWPERPVAIIPFTLEGWHITIPVTVDGHSLKALIDTGSSITVMTDAAATEKFGISLGSDDTPLKDASKSDPLLKYYSHKFGNLSFEGLTVANPNIIIMTDRMGSGQPAFKSSIRGALNDPYNRIKREELIIGMNVLKHLHVYIAYKEKKLYISPAGTGESVLFKTATAPAN